MDNTLSGLYPSFQELEVRCGQSLRSGSASLLTADRSDPLGDAQTSPPLSAARTFAEVKRELSPEFFLQAFDPVEPMLREISALRADEVAERFKDRIEVADANKDVVVRELTTTIDANYDALMGCMAQVQTVDAELCEAEVLVKLGRVRLQQSMHVFREGYVRIAQLQRRRERLLALSRAVREWQGLLATRVRLAQALQSNELVCAAESVFSMISRLSQQQQQQHALQALVAIQSALPKQVQAVRRKTHNALRTLSARRFSVEEYECIVKAYLLLDEISSAHASLLSDGRERVREKVQPRVSLGSNFSDDEDDHSEDDKEEGDSHALTRTHAPQADLPREEAEEEDEDEEARLDRRGECLETLAQRLSLFQLRDIEDCLHRTVMEFIYAGEYKKQRAAAEMELVFSAEHQIAHQDLMDLTELSLPELCKRIPAEMLTLCVVQACACMLDVVHTHFLITQWHTAPFDRRNYKDDDSNRSPSSSSSSSSSGAKGGCSRFLLDTTAADKPFLSLAQSLGQELAVFDEIDALEHQEIDPRGAAELMSAVQRNLVAVFTQPTQGGSERDMCVSVTGDALMRRLLAALHRLEQTRVSMWEAVVLGLTEMLQAVTLTSSLKIEDMMLLTSSLHTMLRVGEDFCGSSSSSLRLCIESKTAEYLAHFHGESFQMMRVMLEVESWQNMFSSFATSTTAATTTTTSSSSPSVRSADGLSNNNNAVTTPTTESAAEFGSVSAMFKSYFLRDSAALATPSALPRMLRLRSQSSESPSLSAEERQQADESAAESLRCALRELFAVEHDAIAAAKKQDNHDEQRTQTHALSVLSLFAKQGSGSDNSLRRLVDLSVDKSQAFAWSVDLLVDQERVANPLRQLLLREQSALSSKKAKNDTSSFVLTQSLLNGLLKYTIKYIDAMVLVPQCAGVLCKCLFDFYEFYLVDIFHSFVPASERERFFATTHRMNSHAPVWYKEFESLKAFCNSVYSHNNGEGRFLMRPVLPRFLPHNSLTISSSGEREEESGDAHCEEVPLRVSSFLESADSSNLHCLQERVVAAESCLFVCQVLQETEPLLELLLSPEDFQESRKFIANFKLVSGDLPGLLYKSAANILVNDAVTVNSIVECGWDLRKERTEPFEWVNAIIAQVTKVWEFISHLDGFGEFMREKMWVEVCNSAFELVLEGLSKVRKCSSEGRVAMTFNVEELHNGLNRVRGKHYDIVGKHYVEDYLRCFFRNEDETMAWIQSSHESYAYRHLHSLLSQKMSSMLNSKKLRDAVAQLDKLYDHSESSAVGSESSAGLASIAKFTARNWRM